MGKGVAGLRDDVLWLKPQEKKATTTNFVHVLGPYPQARDYDDDDYIAGVKANRPGDQRGRVGGAAAAAGGPGGLVRSGSELSLPVGGDQRLNKRMKSQLASKPSDAGRMDMHGRWVGWWSWCS